MQTFEEVEAYWDGKIRTAEEHAGERFAAKCADDAEVVACSCAMAFEGLDRLHRLKAGALAKFVPQTERPSSDELLSTDTGNGQDTGLDDHRNDDSGGAGDSVPAVDPEKDALRARIAELEAQKRAAMDAELDRARAANSQFFSNPDPIPDDNRITDWEEGEGEVEVAPYTPDFTIIPDSLARFAQADETANEFRARLKGLWQRFGIEDGKNFPGGGEALSGEEKITMREIDIVLNSDEGKNAGLLEWMKADRPQD